MENQFPRTYNVGDSSNDPRRSERSTNKSRTSWGRIIFMSMFDDTDQTMEGKYSECFSNSEKVKSYARRFPRGHWSFLRPREENKWYGTHTYKPERQGSKAKHWILGHTTIVPVLQVKTTCYLDIYGMEIQIPSTSGDGSKSWVVKSRGSNRHVEELRYNDASYSPESNESAN